MISDTTKKGEYACLKFETRAIEKGAIVSKPSCECSYDRVLDYQGKMYRVQIKYADASSSCSEGAVQATIGKAAKEKGYHKPYDENEIDVIVVYLPKLDKLCWFEKDIWKDKKKLQIRYENPKNNQKKGCRLASDYIW